MAHRGIVGKIVTPHPFALRYRRANGLPKLFVLRYLSTNGMHDSRYSAMSQDYSPADF